MPTSILPPRTAPWPGDIRLNGVSLMLQRPKNGPVMVRQRALDLANTVSTDFLYSRASPLKERPHTYADLTGGMGLDDQVTTTDLRYSYTLAADLSCPTWQKGPDITTFSPTTTNTWASQFGFELGSNLYGLAGRYVLIRANDSSWTVSHDLGAGKSALHAQTFFSNVGGGAQLAFLAVNGDKAYHFDGASWTQFANFTAIAWLKVGRDLYRAHDTNLYNKVTTDADPTNEANYTADNPVGDKSSPIVSLAQTTGQVLLILKTDGVYTLDSSGNAVRLFPNLQFAPGVDNGKVVGYFGDDVYCTYGDSFFRITPSLTIEPIGPERLTGNSSPVHGHVTAFCGVGELFAHGWVYNETDSYLCKFGGFEPDSTGELQRADNWHGSLSAEFASKSVTGMMTSSIGAPSGHTRTYVGCSDGSMGWWTNPCTPNPLGCASYRWTTGDGFVFFPRWHGANLEDAKALHSLSVIGPHLTSTEYVQFAYKTSVGATSYIDFGTNFNQTRDKVAFPPNTISPLAAFRLTLKSATNVATPIVSSVVVWHAWRPDRLMDVQMSVVAGDGQLLRNGMRLRLTGQQIKEICEAAIDAAGSVEVTLPTGTIENISFLDLQEAYDWDTDIGDWSAVLSMRGVTFATLAKYGTWDRLAAYTWDDLARFTWDELGAL